MKRPLHFKRNRNYYLSIVADVVSHIARPAVTLVTKRAKPPEDWSSAVLLGASHIGDVLYRTGSLDVLQSALPNCKWHYLVEETSAPLLRGHIPEKQLVTFSQRSSNIWNDSDIQTDCRKFNFDAALCSSGISYWHELLFSLKLGIPNRCAFTHKGFSGFVTHPSRSDNFPTPVPLHFRTQVAEITGRAPKWDIRPVVHSSSHDLTEAENIIELHRIDVKKSYAMALTSRQDAALWSESNFATLSKELRTQGLKAILLGGPTDAEYLYSFSKRHDLDAVVLAGDLRLNSLVPLLKSLCFAVCPDSGIRHLANAAGIPVFFFRNLSCHEKETGGYLDTEHDLTPSGSYLDPNAQTELLASVTPSEALLRINLALAQPPKC